MEPSDEQLGQAMREAFTALLVEDRPSAANFSLRLSDDPSSFHALYRNRCLLVASPDARRVVVALLRHLDDHLAPPAPPVFPVQALALVRHGAAMLVPTLLEEDLRASARNLAQDGIQLLDAYSVNVDIDTAEVVVGSGVGVDSAAVDRVVALGGVPRRSDPPVPAGRYPISRWVMVELWSDPGPYSRATAVRRASLLLRGGPAAAGPETFSRLADLFADVPAVGVAPSGRREVLDIARWT
jgi:hypothetical protein